MYKRTKRSDKEIRDGKIDNYFAKKRFKRGTSEDEEYYQKGEIIDCKELCEKVTDIDLEEIKISIKKTLPEVNSIVLKGKKTF